MFSTLFSQLDRFPRGNSAANFHPRVLKKKKMFSVLGCMFVTVGSSLFIIAWTPPTGNSYTCALSPYPRKMFLIASQEKSLLKISPVFHAWLLIAMSTSHSDKEGEIHSTDSAWLQNSTFANSSKLEFGVKKNLLNWVRKCSGNFLCLDS